MTAGPNRALAIAPAYVRTRGGPLVLIAVVLSGWIGVRAMWWEDPFPAAVSAKEMSITALRLPPAPTVPGAAVVPALALLSPAIPSAALPSPFLWSREAEKALTERPANLPVMGRSLSGANLSAPPELPAAERREPAPPPAPAPFLPPPLSNPVAVTPGRWSLDAWAFGRQGSGAAPVSQGRVPVYGASQAGAVLQYRLAPGSARDPRLYARAYRALVRRGESELALGASLRPVARVPLRMAGEVRYTDAAFSNIYRPAAYAVTELAPLPLPYGAQLEAYGQAGWVGGPGATGFADGQASITGGVPLAARLSDNALRLGLGVAVWGGAQRDAQRFDIGPTMRFDLRLGEVPARLTIDWRERVAGDASPDSGVAATLSTGF
jgi:hypothetical protein